MVGQRRAARRSTSCSSSAATRPATSRSSTRSARGTGPLLSGAAAIAFLGERPSALALAGALIIVAAVLSRRRAAARRARRSASRVLTGSTIASYTLWDKHAVGPVELPPVVYDWGTNLPDGADPGPGVLQPAQRTSTPVWRRRGAAAASGS